MTPQELYRRIKTNETNIGFDLSYKGKEPYVNTYNAHTNTKYPLLAFHYEEDVENHEIIYRPEFELYNFTDTWMCKELDKALPIQYNMEYTDFCIKVNELVIGEQVYPCAHTETFTPNDDESIYEALENCKAYAIEQFHILSHKMKCFMYQHHEFEELIMDSDRIVLRQLFYILSHLSEKK